MFSNIVRRRLSSFIKGTRDRFGGVNVYSYENQGIPAEDFGNVLKTSIHEWRQTGVRGLWFHVSDDQTAWIKDLLESGFKFHHAKDKTAVLTNWLPTDEESGIPEYPSLYLGVGTITVNEKNEILVIKEKVRWYNNWKFPGGYVDKGENILDAAVREVFEETGVETEPMGIVGFRHVLPQPGLPFPPFDCSDMYVICALQPKPGGNREIRRQEREVSEAEWLPLETFKEKGSEHNTIFLNSYLKAKENNTMITPNDFVMKYQQFERHMLMYMPGQIPDTNNGAMNWDDWDKHWQTGAPFWHEAVVNEALQRNFNQNAKRVFVPLCGKTVDMIWLQQQNCEVVGVEFNEDGILEFFRENEIAYEKDGDTFTSVGLTPSITIHCRDLFETKDSKVFDFVWDRGSMVAINVADRPKYADLIRSLLAPSGEVLIQAIERERGPPGAPFNLTKTHLAKLYPEKKIEYLEEQELDDPVKVERFGKVVGTFYRMS